MPVVFRHKGFRFFFYANEGDPREPMHIHVAKDGLEAKFRLWPDVVVAYNDGHSAKDLRFMQDVVMNRRAMIVGAWNEFFG